MVSNSPGKPRVFFFFLASDGESQLSSEHPVLQGGFAPQKPQAPAFSDTGQFLARAFLFCPLFFKDYSSRGLTLQSRAYLGAGRPVEDPQWIHPFVTGPDGQIYWSSLHDRDFCDRTGPHSERGILKLHPHQTYTLDSRELSLASGFGGGLAAACRPVMNQTLMKIEVEVQEWGLSTYSHFRPGSASSRRLLPIQGRDGLLSDYLISGVQVNPGGEQMASDSLLALMNVEFEADTPGRPTLELFGPQGFLSCRELPEIPALGSQFHWVSDLFPISRTVAGPFTVRLMDSHSVTVLSALHVDFRRRQLAIDHGSDRFSTYLEYFLLVPEDSLQLIPIFIINEQPAVSGIFCPPLKASTTDRRRRRGT